MVACLVVVAALLSTQNLDPVAMVVNLKGTATVERGQAPARPLETMTLLQPGDRVKPAADGEVTLVFLVDGHRERLKGEALVDSKGCQPAGAVLPKLKLSVANLDGLRALAKSTRAGVSVARGDFTPGPELVAPLDGASILTDRPEFTWRAARADSYQIEILSGDGLLWKSVVKPSRWSLPAQERLPEFGVQYRWRVTAMRGGTTVGAPVVDRTFKLLAKSDIAELANVKPLLADNAPAGILMAALIYEAHAVHDEALRRYENLAEIYPDEARFPETLATYYQRAGRPDLARMAQERARRLAKLAVP